MRVQRVVMPETEFESWTVLGDDQLPIQPVERFLAYLASIEKLRRGAGMESVKQLLGHASITTTIDTYGHLTVEDARATLQDAGWFTGREVRW